MTTRWLRASLPPCVGSCSIVIIGKLMPRHAVPSLNTSKFGITGSDFIQLWAISVHCSSNCCYIQRLKPRVHEIGASPEPYDPRNHTKLHEGTRIIVFVQGRSTLTCIKASEVSFTPGFSPVKEFHLLSPFCVLIGSCVVTG